jgi:hypothetical protein
MRLTHAPLMLACLASLLACSGSEKWGTSSITLLGPGVMNDPQNKSLRFDILKFGLDSFCTEMKKRGVPLKLSDEHPVVGRFFASECQSEVVDEDQRKSLLVRFTGEGYAWTNITARLGFRVVALVEYSPDFQLADNRALYVYFRPRNVQTATFETEMVESRLATTALQVTGIDANRVGKQILSAQLDRGFTVIRSDERGEMDYGLGFVSLGEHPYRPFQIISQKTTLANDRTELHGGQQDYLGAFEVTESGQALTVTATIDGAPSVDVMVVSGTVGRQMLERYVKQPTAAPLTAPSLSSDSVLYGTPWQRTVPVEEGTYFVVLDNSAVAGQSQPPVVAGDDRAVKIDYVVQLGDAP